MLVVPISTPGRSGPVIRFLEFVNVAGAFVEMEKNVAVRLAEHLSHVFVVASLWGVLYQAARHTPARSSCQADSCPRKRDDRISDALVDTCDGLHAKNPGCHIFVLFLANLVDGERWDDRSKMNDAASPQRCPP